MRGVEFAEIRDAIVDAFDKDDFDMLLFERLDFDRPNEVGDAGFKKVVNDVLKRFVDEGRDPYLIAEVAAARPLRKDVQAVYRKYAEGLIGDAWTEKVAAEQIQALERYGLAPHIELRQAGKALRSEAVTSEGFQRIVRQKMPLLDVFLFFTQGLKQTRRVCRVEVDGAPRGTGFLVGPETILTNHHVVKDVIAARLEGRKIRCLFEFWRRQDGLESEGTAVSALGSFADWHLDSSPGLPKDDDEDAGAPPPTFDQLDHALIRLERRIGEEPLSRNGPPRGWIKVPETAPALSKDGPVSILQHPNGEPIKLGLDFDSILSVNEPRTRVRYATNTDSGSSGSPCFDASWGLIALHHFGDPLHRPPEYNQGVPIDAIRARLARQGKDGFLGGDPP